MDILIAPARNEGFGRTLVEAMHGRTPGIASAQGGHTEIIRHGETGLLIPPDDIDGFAQAVIELLEDRVRAAAIAATAQRQAATRYRLESHVNALCDVYDGLLAR